MSHPRSPLYVTTLVAGALFMEMLDGSGASVTGAGDGDGARSLHQPDLGQLLALGRAGGRVFREEIP